MSFISNLLGYVLNYIYTLVNNYGIALIIFCILIKIILLPISFKQQQSAKKSSKIQPKIKEIQEKYKGKQELINQEIMELYKREKMSPFSGCFSAIIQLVLLLAMFFLVQSPLTYMKKIDINKIETYKNEIKENNDEKRQASYPEIEIIKQKGNEDSDVYINMDFLGIDLSSIPTKSDFKAYIIPVLYILSSFVSTTLINKNMTNTLNTEKKDGEENNIMPMNNKTMSYGLLIVSASIAIIAPLGLALYWLINNILMIIERLIIDKFIKEQEEI